MCPEVWILVLYHEKPSGKGIFMFKEDLMGECEGEREQDQRKESRGICEMRKANGAEKGHE